MAQSGFEIVGGPSKFDIMVSLFDGENEKQRPVEFILANGTRVSVLIWGVEREGAESVDEWVLKGIRADDKKGQRVGICFYTSKRTGWLYPKDRQP